MARRRSSITITGCPLTARELRILQACLQQPSATPGQLARELICSENTIRTHLSNIHAKLQVSTHCEMVLRAIQYGWVRVPPPPPPDFRWHIRRGAAGAAPA